LKKGGEISKKILLIGKLSIIKKIVVLTQFENNTELYNLALADVMPNGTFSDTTQPRNQDTEKVIATVLQIIFQFFTKFPDKLIYFEGNSPERTRLYRIVISKEISKIQDYLKVYGVVNGQLEEYKRNKYYEAYVISKKM
jgi:hypothetical protein